MSPAAAADREPRTDAGHVELLKKCAQCLNRRVSNAGRHWYCQQATAPDSTMRKLYCIEARSKGGICGPDAVLFRPEPKDPS